MRARRSAGRRELALWLQREQAAVSAHWRPLQVIVGAGQAG